MVAKQPCKQQAASFEPSDVPSSKSEAHSKFTVSNFAVPESGLEKTYSNACAEDSLVPRRPHHERHPFRQKK